MGDLNRASVLGRLGADPEIRTFENGDRVCNMRLATSDRWKDRETGEKKERTEWHSVVVLGPLVEIAERFLSKGKRVLVEGQLRTRKWQDQSGNDRYSTEIVVRGFDARLDIIDWPEGDGRTQGQQGAYGGDDMPPAPGGSDMDSEIPF